MSRRVQSLFVVGALGLLAGCAQQRYEPIVYTDAAPTEQWSFKPIEIQYMDTQSPAWNFQHVLEHNAWKCGQEAAMGYILYSQLRGYGSSKRPDDRAQALADCQQYAYQRGNEAIARLKQAKVSAKTLDLSQDLYAKWSAYLVGMSISAPKDRLATNQYEASKRALLAEDKFSQ
ncbi:hypothetical protein ABXV19_25695 [Pseudomonas alkylphenolica]|uniref:hypothetical protein n=1 Tax=Pseudomonas alkylphenolica TaxID=237609 RepID=UPI0033910834